VTAIAILLTYLHTCNVYKHNKYNNNNNKKKYYYNCRDSATLLTSTTEHTEQALAYMLQGSPE